MVQSEIDRINAADNQTTGRILHLEQVVGNIQSNGVSSSSEGKGGGRWGTNKSAMEHKAVMNLKTQGNDRAGYRMWHEKLVNAFAQVNGQYRGILERVAKEIDKGTDMSIMQGNADWESWVSMVDIASDKVDMSKLNEDMYSVLMDKSEGDAWLRVKSVNSGHGMEAFVKVYKWFMSTSGQGLSERARAIMAPTPPKSEGDMAEAVDKWNEGLRLLENHPGYSMHVNLKVTALKQLMVGRAKDQFETWEEDMKNQGVEDNQWRWMLGKVQEYATRRRLEANLAKGKNPMDVDGIDGGSSWDSQGNWDWQQDEAGYMWGASWDNAGDIDALGKGKAMGKGGKSKGKGKGVFNGKCYNCEGYGHSARFCPMPPQGKGKGKGKGGGSPPPPANANLTDRVRKACYFHQLGQCKKGKECRFEHTTLSKAEFATMPVPASSRAQSPGKGGGGGGKGGGGKSQSPGTKLKKLWCAEFAKSGSCKLGNKCPIPHHTEEGVKAVKLGLDNSKAAGKAKAKPKPKAKGKAAPAAAAP